MLINPIQPKLTNLLVLTLLASFFALGIARAESKPDYLAMSGADLYARFCASCHGSTGRGDGPVSKSLATEVPNLTLIARRHGGVFPREQIEKIVDGRILIGAHRSRDMPLWGELFLKSEHGNPDAEKASERIVSKLVEHVQSLQRSAISNN